MAKSDFLIKDVLPGKLNAMVKNLMSQTGVDDPNEAVRLFNSGEYVATQKIAELLFLSESNIHVYDHGDHIRFRLPATDGTADEEWIKRLEDKGSRVGDYAKSMLRSADFKPTTGITTEVAVLKGILFEDNDRTTKNIRKFAAEDRKLKIPNAEISCLIREQFTDEEIKAMGLKWIFVMHEPIKDSRGVPSLLGANRDGDGRWLSTCYGRPDDRWDREDGFAFAVSHGGIQN